MTQKLLTPPPELFTKWLSEALLQHDAKPGTIAAMVADKAAQWGADHELEACVKLANEMLQDGNSLRLARRPKPLSLKEQALALLDQHEEGWRPSPKDWYTIRTAIEALPND
jgi:hypothetical protein